MSIKITRNSPIQSAASLAPYASLMPDSETNQRRAANGLAPKTTAAIGGSGMNDRGGQGSGQEFTRNELMSGLYTFWDADTGFNAATMRKEARDALDGGGAPAGSGSSGAGGGNTGNTPGEAVKSETFRYKEIGQPFTEVNPETDTVRGQLQNYYDPNDPIMKRVAQQAKNAAAARGMTNSSIAVGNATGAMIDQAGEFAAADAGFYNDRKTENQRAATHLTSTRMNNRTQLEAQRMQNQTQRDIQRMQDRAALQRTRLDLNSRESVAQMEIEARQMDAEMDRLSRERIASLNAENQMEIAQYREAAQDERQRSDQYSMIWRDYNQAVMNIDIRASPASQRQQLERINDAYKLRLEAQDFLERAAGIGGTGRQESNVGTNRPWMTDVGQR